MWIIGKLLSKYNNEASGTAHLVKAVPAKPNELNLSPGTHMVKGEKQLMNAYLQYTHTHTHTNLNKNKHNLIALIGQYMVVHTCNLSNGKQRQADLCDFWGQSGLYNESQVSHRCTMKKTCLNFLFLSGEKKKSELRVSW